ncbi:MAG: DUF5693 family protein, partial [Cellulosilyticaceae bacterium]
MNKTVKQLMYIILAFSMVVCIGVGFGRVKVENDYKEVQVAVKYTTLLEIASQTGTPLEEVMKTYRDLGVNVLFVTENTLQSKSNDQYSNLHDQGIATILDGYEAARWYPNIDEIVSKNYYIEVKDMSTYEYIIEQLTIKGFNVRTIENGEDKLIEFRGPLNALYAIGIGYNKKDMELAASLGYVISPQIKTWELLTEESIEYVMNDVASLPNLGTIYFADSSIPEPTEDKVIELSKKQGLGYVEFFSHKQKGFKTLAENIAKIDGDYNIVRLHTLTDAEASKYTLEKLIDRYMLALTERNMRVFLFKMPSGIDIMKNETALQLSIETFVEKVEEEGYTVAQNINQLKFETQPYWIKLAAGLGTIAVFTLLALELVDKRIAYVLGILVVVGYTLALKIMPSMSIKMMALVGTILFPTYGVLKYMFPKTGSIKETLKALLMMTMMTFGGAMTVVGLLSQTDYAIGVNGFIGVKFAHLMPILLVILIVCYKKYGINTEFYKGLLNKKITYMTIVVIGIVGVVLMIYTSRTGNGGTVSSFELAFRQALDSILGVRPRTKEFLIGYPSMIALLYFGYKDRYLPILALGIIGQ